MTHLRKPIRAACLLALTACAAAFASRAQTPVSPTSAPAKKHIPKPETPAFNSDLVLIDPAHGAADHGASLPNNLLEKDVTLALANRLRTALTGKGFTVVMTRENSTDDVPSDARVELANRSRPVACILLHAASGGHGVHLYTSSLTARDSAQADDHSIQPWDTAQASATAQSMRLASDLVSSLNGIRIPLLTGKASVQPIDSLTCPAIALEIAPLNGNGESVTPVSDSNYQQRVAEAAAQGLVFWRSHAQSAAMLAEALKNQSPVPVTSSPVKPKPRQKPVLPKASQPAPAETPAGAPPTGATR